MNSRVHKSKSKHKTEINAYTYKQRIAFKKQGNKTKMIEVMVKWEEAIKDCKRALELDSTAVKGHYFLGEAYMEQSMYDESIKNLTKGKYWSYILFFCEAGAKSGAEIRHKYAVLGNGHQLQLWVTKKFHDFRQAII